MASVVLAEDTLLGRRVALKRMHPSAADARGLLRLRREALIGASMSRPNLVSIYDVIDSQDGNAVIVMEYVEGETLRDALMREGKLVPREALRVLRGVAAGLEAIHARHIVHRDVKPANVLLGVDGSVKLADLGIASVPDHTRITTAGTVLGSFRYMAPEQLKDGPVTLAVDVYALAAVAFEVLSGCRARRESNALAVAHAIATQPPPDLRAVWPTAPAGAADVLMAGMCRDPAGRPRSAGELVARLEAGLDGTAALPGGVARGRRRTPWAAAAVAPAADMAVSAAISSGGRPTRVSADNKSDSSAARAGSATPQTATEARQTDPAPPAASAAGPRKTFRARRPIARVLAPLALVLVAAGVVLALLTGGRPSPTSSHGPPRASGTRIHSGSAGRTAAPSIRTNSAGTTPAGTAATSSPASTTSSGSAAARPRVSPGGQAATASTTPPPSRLPSVTPAIGSPLAAVQSFYQLAAAHNYSQAWALADPTFRRQLGGYESFQAGQAADRSIIFDVVRLLRQSSSIATVYVETTSVRATVTQHCAGTVQVVRPGASGGWLVHMIDINCSQ